MIASFADQEAQRIFERQVSRRYGNLQKVVLRKLLLLAAAGELEDLKTPPGNRLEALKGNRKGQHSIRVNDQFRICFVWKGSYAYDIQIADYH